MRSKAAIAVVMACLVGIIIDFKPTISLLIIGLAALTALALVLPLSTVVNLVIVASFLSRFSLFVVDFHVRPEHVTALLLFMKILLTKQKGRVGPYGSRAVMAMVALVILNLASTVVKSPNVAESLNIVGWLFLDAVLLWSLLQVPESMLRRAVLRTGLFCALVVGALAIAAWAMAVAGGPRIWVQPDPAYGGYAAYVWSYEANILAGSLVLWGFIALASLRSGKSVTWINRAAAVVCPLALIATDTRAAIIAYLLGALILGVRGGVFRLRHLVVGIAIVTVAVTALSFGTHASSLGDTAKKLSNFSLTSGDGGLRVESWSIAFHDMGTEQVVLGLGTNSYGQRHLDPTRPGLNDPGYLASLPIQVLYDAGGLAVLCVLVILWMALPKERRARSLGYAMAAAYLVISMATSPFWFSFTWIFVALGVLQRDRSATKQIAARPNLPLDQSPRVVSS